MVKLSARRGKRAEIVKVTEHFSSPSHPAVGYQAHYRYAQDGNWKIGKIVVFSKDELSAYINVVARLKRMGFDV